MLELEHVTFACDDPERLAAFWEAALDGERRGLPESLDSAIVDRPGAGPALLFREAPKGTERDLPIHLDVSTEDREVAVERLRDLGATARETKTNETENHAATWTVMEDPEGNGFCVTEHHD